MSEEIPTKEKLALALEAAGKKKYKHMIKNAREGFYDDFESPLAMPKTALIQDLKAYGETELMHRVMNGEFDATKEEASRWRNSLDGLETFDDPIAVGFARDIFKSITGIDPLDKKGND